MKEKKDDYAPGQIYKRKKNDKMLKYYVMSRGDAPIPGYFIGIVVKSNDPQFSIALSYLCDKKLFKRVNKKLKLK